MASASTNPEKKKNASFPPKRGQIKAQIFESLAETVVSAFSRLGEALGRIRGSEGSSGRSSVSSTPNPSVSSTPNPSASSTPHPCAYNSD
ncbi:hypothetical protein I3843_13G090000 [Carya illinoinensis]|uniref:Uncharacterized protein n=1 Tax=Carya illinoinensis TaxID=32201 RepID=A0A8T1NIC9_CARIL|nr:hypothetical protein I3760_13G102500 [Carya illinoinensis]KAG6631636.1 hypothetical protein CIPAW_13G104300 [Carya illinoinensis]KAG6681643.1 hypothetical protein I3842_13G103200 [Carya illinoinensis]KAG7949956.1 hypothetical protein I3843_13G090000 [Carya illinoinensis]